MDGMVFGFGVAALMCGAAIVAGCAEGLAAWVADVTAPRVEVSMKEVKGPRRNAKGQFTRK